MKQTRSPLYPIFLFVIINLIIFTLSRLGLAIWQSDRVSAVAGWGQLFLQGSLIFLFQSAVKNDDIFNRTLCFFICL